MKTHEILAILMLVLVVGWVVFMGANSGAGAPSAGTNGGWSTQTIASSPSQAAAGGAYAGAQTPSAVVNNPGGAGGAQAAAGAQGASDSAPQTVTIQVRGAGAQYSPSTIRVKQGDHVRLDFDPSTLPGCKAQVIIWGLNEQITVSPSNHVLEFTADKAGTYRMSCGMGMINGVFIVDAAGANTAGTANSAGSAQTGGSAGAAGGAQLKGAIDPTSLPGPSGGTCGGSSGGCGCGGG